MQVVLTQVEPGQFRLELQYWLTLEPEAHQLPQSMLELQYWLNLGPEEQYLPQSSMELQY